MVFKYYIKDSYRHYIVEFCNYYYAEISNKIKMIL